MEYELEMDVEQSYDESGDDVVVDLSAETITQLLGKLVEDEVCRETRRLVKTTKRWESLNKRLDGYAALRDAMLLREIKNSATMILNKSKNMVEDCVSYQYKSWGFADTAGQWIVSVFCEAYRAPEINVEGIQPWEDFFNTKLREATKDITRTFETALRDYMS